MRAGKITYNPLVDGAFDTVVRGLENGDFVEFVDVKCGWKFISIRDNEFG